MKEKEIKELMKAPGEEKHWYLPGTNIQYRTGVKLYQFVLRELGLKFGEEIKALAVGEDLKAIFEMVEGKWTVEFLFHIVKEVPEESPHFIFIDMVRMRCGSVTFLRKCDDDDDE